MGTVPRNEAPALAGESPSNAVSATFSILGVTVCVKGSPASDIEPVIREYAAFRSDDVSPSWDIAWDGHASPTTLTFDGKVHPCIPQKSAASIISTKIMDRVYEAGEDFYLLHGAAAAWQNVLIIFPGQTGSGKSSLSIALARSGWSLFSDEVIAISRESLQVVPFPRAVSAWGSSPALRELLRAQNQREPFVPAVGKRTKSLIPFSFFNQPPAPLSPAALVCLRGGRREARRGGQEIAVTYWDERMEKLAREKGIHDHLRTRKVGEFWCIRSDNTEIVETICTSLGGIVIDRDLVKSPPPAFAKRPVLEPVSPSECLDAIWAVFENGRSLTNREGGAVKLYLKLARIVKTMPCFWLRPGPSSSTCELLRNLADKLNKRDVSRE